MDLKDEEHHVGLKVRWHKHVRGFTWSWFIMPLASLGLSLLLGNLPFRFHGLTTIGIIVYLLGVVEFVILLFVVTSRFLTKHGTFCKSIARDDECYFLSTVLMSIASMIMGCHVYAHPVEGSRLATTLRVVFWIYVAFAYLFGVYIYYILFTQKHHLQVPNMTPAWMLPMFPAILTGPMAGTIAPTLTEAHRFPILIAGLTIQGCGTLLSILVLAIYTLRLFHAHFPEPDSRPGLFMAVGPPAFTGVGLLKMSLAIPHNYSYFQRYPASIGTLQTMGLFVTIFFWTFAFYWACIALVAVIMEMRKMRFHLTWYSFIFPNCGLGIALLDIGVILECDGIGWVGTGWTIIIAAVWLIVNAFHVEAIWRGRELVLDR